MSSSNLDKQELIAELNQLINDWQPKYIQYLLKEAQGMHGAAILPPVEENSLYIACSVVHVGENDRALCGRKNVRLLPEKDFEKTNMKKCFSCQISLEKRKSGNSFNVVSRLKRESQEFVIIAVYETAGRKLNEWISLTDLYPNTDYKTRPALTSGLKNLERRGIVEMKMVKHKYHVRLIMDCIRETDNDLFVKINHEE